MVVITGKKTLFALFTLVFAIILCGTASATDWTVGPGGTYDYTTIQSAINSGTTLAGDSIIVYDDSGNPYTYQENVGVNKDLTITTTGQVTVDGSLNPTYPVFTVTSAGSQSTLDGFTITGATGNAGVMINGAANVNLNDLTIKNCQRGVVIQGTSSNINIDGATITGTTSNGIYIKDTTTNLSVINTSISGCGASGIEKNTLSNLYGITISNTAITNPSGYGIFLTDGIGGGMEFYLTGVVINNTTVTGATIDGIRVTMGRPSISGNVTVTDTTVSNSTQHGMYLLTRGVFDFERNTLTGNGFNSGTGADGQFYGLYLSGDGNTSTIITGDTGFTGNRNGVYLQNVGEEANPIVFVKPQSEWCFFAECGAGN